MDIGALGKEGFTAWLPFNDIEVCIRPVDLGKIRAIRKKCMKVDFDASHRKVRVVDDARFSVALGKEAVVDWRGITNDGKDFPFNDENRDFLMLHWAAFGDWVAEASQDLVSLHEASKEKAVKN